MSTEQREINALGERGGPQRKRPTARRARTGHNSSGVTKIRIAFLRKP
jgi:hypothetical protein